MGTWITILNLGARGESLSAREALNFRLPLELRSPIYGSPVFTYDGPLAEAIGSFIKILPPEDKGMAESRVCDFIDYVLGVILAGVQRTLVLAEFCRAEPGMSISEIVDNFPGWKGRPRTKS